MIFMEPLLRPLGLPIIRAWSAVLPLQKLEGVAHRLGPQQLLTAQTTLGNRQGSISAEIRSG